MTPSSFARNALRPQPCFRPLAAGLVAAVVGGVVWGLIVKWTDYEVGFVAWGIGFLVGLAVVTAARTRGLVLQVVAVLCALLGILIGKYLSFVWALQERSEGRVRRVVDIPVFSMDTFDLFRDNLGICLRLDRPALGRARRGQRLARSPARGAGARTTSPRACT